MDLINTINTANSLKAVIDEYAVALLVFYDGGDIDFVEADNAIIDRFGRDTLERVKRDARRIANS